MTLGELRRLYAERREERTALAAALADSFAVVRMRYAEIMVPKCASERARTMALSAVYTKNVIDGFRWCIKPYHGALDLGRFVPQALMVVQSCEGLFRDLYEHHSTLANRAFQWPTRVLWMIWQNRMVQRVSWQRAFERGQYGELSISLELLRMLDDELDIVLEALWGKVRAECYRELVSRNIERLTAIAEVEKASFGDAVAGNC